MNIIRRAATVLTVLIGLFSAGITFWDTLKQKTNLSLPLWLFIVIACCCFIVILVIEAKLVKWGTVLKGINDRLQQLQYYNNLLSVCCLLVAICLTVLCVLEGVQLKAMSEMNATYFAGTLPSNIKEINDLIARTTRRLDVLVDFPAYGCFSDPDRYEDYKRKVLDVHRGNRQVRLCAYNKAQAEFATKAQFNSEASESIQKRPSFAAWVRSSHGGVAPKTKDEFVEFLLQDDDHFSEELSRAGLGISRTITSAPPLYVWLRDGEEAIFSFYNVDGADESSFRTTNKELISILEKIFAQYQK